MVSLKAVCVFCASSSHVDAVYLEAARELGRRFGREGIRLVYGGASIGLMGEVARGVHDEKGRVVGVLPEFFKDKDIEYSEADELIVTRDMRERKAVMDERSDAFVVLPGGVGTLEEAMEIFSLIQLRQTIKPLVFLNTNGFYDNLMVHLQQIVAQKFAKEETMKMFALLDTPEAVMDFLKKWQPPELHSKWF